MRKVKLYDYQIDMKRRISAALASHRSVMVQMPTGTGKTCLLASVVYGWLQRHDGAEVWIVAHRRELVEQIRGTARRLFVDMGASGAESLLSRLRVVSIQWLSRHYGEIAVEPGLIVVDEAHHAVARTYKDVIEAFPKAKVLGLTATPCRLRKGGFTELFDMLLQSWQTKRFIAEGRLSLYDYMSVRADSEEQRRVFGLTRRGADGDFSLLEMSEKLDVRPSIERLCDTVLRYAAGKKGIVYAIDIRHAEHIAEYYREHGIEAVAISSKTPAREREEIVERFKNWGTVTNCHELTMNSRDKVTNYHELTMNFGMNYSGEGETWERNRRELDITQDLENKEITQDLENKEITQNSQIQNRRRSREQFKIQNSKFKTPVRVLVNFDLFGEGFDCPDVEFIQLARPTLSLAKYLQQVGRGMRVFEGKKYCLILDNVGSYRLFGLPSDDRDWQAMFEGSVSGKGNISQVEERYSVAYSLKDEAQIISADAQTELTTILTHEGQRMDLDATYRYHVTGSENGLHGIADNNGNEVLPCVYDKVELKAYGFAKLHSKRKLDRERPWMDLQNGVRFVREPRIKECGFLKFSTSDGTKLYPRVRTRQMNEDCFVLSDALEHGIDDGLQFKKFYIQPSEPETLYIKQDQIDDVTLWADERGLLAWRKGLDSKLHPISRDDWETRKTAHADEIKKYEEEKEEYIKYFIPKIRIDDMHGKVHLADYEESSYLRITRGMGNAIQVFYRRHFVDKWESVGSYMKIFPQAYGIRVVQNREGKYVVRTELFQPFETPEHQYDFAELQDNRVLYLTESGKDYWVYLENKTCFTRKPEFLKIGFMDFIKVGDVYMECAPYSRETYRRAEIRIYDDVCFLGKRKAIVKTNNNLRHFFIQRRYVDGKRFVVSESQHPGPYEPLYDMYYDGKMPPTISATAVSAQSPLPLQRRQARGGAL